MNPEQDQNPIDNHEVEANIASMETRQMMEELLKLTRENNKVLAGQRRAKKFESLRGVLKLVVLVVILFFAYKFINPYLQGAKKIYESVSSKVETINNAAQKINNANQAISGFSDEFGEFSKLFGSKNTQNQ
jgi:uncharacterized protein YoxC